jgi:integrase
MTTIEPTAKRARKSSVVLTDRKCEKRVDKRIRIYDRKCPGLFVSIITAGVSTFFFKFTDRGTGKQRCKWLGVYCSETFTVENARSNVYGLKNRIGNGENIAETLRQQKVKAVKQGITVDQLIENRIEFIKSPVKKKDGEMRPMKKSWEGTARHLRNLVGPRLGHMIAREVTADDIATLSNDILAGRHGGKASASNARHMRRAASAMFKWALVAGNSFVDANPCVNLPELPKEHARTRVLSEDEIRTLWHGLDRSDLPWDRRTRLALKFALVTMLRSGEMLPIRRDELDIKNRVVNIPACRVKKERVINQPLSDLALEIIHEAMGNYDFAFAGRFGDAPLSRQAMSGALKGTKKTPGICALLGLKPFTPHDLRRTAATMCRRKGLSRAIISLILDHQVTKDDDGNDLPSVTDEVYTDDGISRVAEKRPVLDAWSVKLREIISEPVATELPLAA